MVSWVGYRQIGVPYRRAARVAGTTKYPFAKMVRFAVDGLLSFSIKPLRLSTYLGFASAGLALAAILYALAKRLLSEDWVTGWTALIIAILFLGGVQLISLGIIGEYIGRLYGEAKRRPLFLIRERLGFEERALALPPVERRRRDDRRIGRGNGRRRTVRSA
jgi:dolichol-phosphate mannosyltransferase